MEAEYLAGGPCLLREATVGQKNEFSSRKIVHASPLPDIALRRQTADFNDL
jgi:hypothetical protein